MGEETAVRADKRSAWVSGCPCTFCGSAVELFAHACSRRCRWKDRRAHVPCSSMLACLAGGAGRARQASGARRACGNELVKGVNIEHCYKDADAATASSAHDRTLHIYCRCARTLPALNMHTCCCSAAQLLIPSLPIPQPWERACLAGRACRAARQSGACSLVASRAELTPNRLLPLAPIAYARWAVLGCACWASSHLLRRLRLLRRSRRAGRRVLRGLQQRGRVACQGQGGARAAVGLHA